MKDDIFNIASRVRDEKSFRDFLIALAEDRHADAVKERANLSSPYGPTDSGWENTTVEAFLEAASAWASATENRQTDINPWQRCAQIISSGKFYE